MPPPHTHKPNFLTREWSTDQVRMLHHHRNQGHLTRKHSSRMCTACFCGWGGDGPGGYGPSGYGIGGIVPGESTVARH